MQSSLIRRCISDSDKSSESRFCQKNLLCNNNYTLTFQMMKESILSTDSDVCTIVRTFYLIWINHFAKIDHIHGYPIWLSMVLSTAGAISLNEIQIKHAPPSSINWSKFECYNLPEFLNV
ncbi:hypothetical protein QL285_026954 [Trifolium repens]|nr:hypothetical protein QL285_026954 [Trifolium repens]